jgi:acyl dehydratase
MADDDLITDEMRAAVGKEGEPSVREVDRTQIRLFARSVGHTDPIYYDVEAAKAAGYRDLPAPPGYLGTPIFTPGAPARAATEFQPSRPMNRRLNGGTEIEYLGDIVAGDVLTATSHIASFTQTKGSIGDMLITTTKTVIKNQDGKVVAVSTGTGIRY